MSGKQIKLRLVQCLRNNQFFDAALSAMGHFLLRLAKLNEDMTKADEQLNSAENYYQPGAGFNGVPSDNLPDMVFLSRHVATYDSLDELKDSWEMLVGAMRAELYRILGSPNYTVVDNTIQCAITAAADGSYIVRLVYAAVEGMHKGEEFNNVRNTDSAN